MRIDINLYCDMAIAAELAIPALIPAPTTEDRRTSYVHSCWEVDLLMLFAWRAEYEPHTRADRYRLAEADAHFDALAPQLQTHFGFTRTESPRS